LIGEGAVGWVYRGYSTQEGPCALKFFKTDSGDPGVLGRFHRERRIAVGLSHESLLKPDPSINLSRFVEGGEWIGSSCVQVMKLFDCSLEFVIGFLRKYPDEPRIPQQLAGEYARQLTRVLGYLHDKKRVHRDVKPSNVLIKLQSLFVDTSSLEGSHIALCDIGLMTKIGESLSDLKIGNDGYKDPELFNQHGDPLPPDRQPASPAEDIFGLGRLLSELAEVVEGKPRWLTEVAEECSDRERTKRPAVDDRLINRLSPRRVEESNGGWRPYLHRELVGREQVIAEFQAFYREREADEVGGVFLIEGDMGSGKTALLTNWPDDDRGRGQPGGRGHPPAYFFSRLENRVSLESMLPSLMEEIGRRHRLDDQSGNDRSAAEPSPRSFSALLEEISRGLDHAAGARLVIVIDALDEAKAIEKVVLALPNPPPRGVFLVVSSQPHRALDPLKQAEAYVLKLDADRNSVAVAKYLQAKLPELAGNPAQAKWLALALGGSFLLAVDLVKQVRGKIYTVDAYLRWARDVGMTGRPLPLGELIRMYYNRLWSRIHEPLQPDEQSEVIELLALLAAAPAPMPEKHVLEILGWTDIQLDQVVDRVSRFVVRVECKSKDGYHGEYCLRLSHPSVLQFLTDQENMGPLRLGVVRAHRRIAGFFLDQRQQRGTWSALEPYGRAMLVQHLLGARDTDLTIRAAEILSDLGYLQSRLPALSD
jgi:serine/threonine protein kinase